MSPRMDPSGEGPLVATILDSMSDACWSPEFRNLRLERSHWRSQLDQHRPDLLLVESAFSGANGTWARTINHFGSPHPELVRLVDRCRAEGVPTVFWSKEDPVNYAWFIGAASLFDRVFTVDGNMLDRYRADLGRAHVGILPFAAQPTLHFPDPDVERSGKAAFAGTWYARKHAARRDQLEMLLTAAIPFGLSIYDRMDRASDPRFDWPPALAAHVVGSVPYPDMGRVYNSHRVFLNVNTVTDSPTMCARRIYELAACGTPILSGPSAAIGVTVPASVVSVATTGEEAASALGALIEQEAPTTEGPAWISEGNTYRDRFATSLDAV